LLFSAVLLFCLFFRVADLLLPCFCIFFHPFTSTLNCSPDEDAADEVRLLAEAKERARVVAAGGERVHVSVLRPEDNTEEDASKGTKKKRSRGSSRARASASTSKSKKSSANTTTATTTAVAGTDTITAAAAAAAATATAAAAAAAAAAATSKTASRRRGRARTFTVPLSGANGGKIGHSAAQQRRGPSQYEHKSQDKTGNESDSGSSVEDFPKTEPSATNTLQHGNNDDDDDDDDDDDTGDAIPANFRRGRRRSSLPLLIEATLAGGPELGNFDDKSGVTLFDESVDTDTRVLHSLKRLKEGYHHDRRVSTSSVVGHRGPELDALTVLDHRQPDLDRRRGSLDMYPLLAARRQSVVNTKKYPFGPLGVRLPTHSPPTVRNDSKESSPSTTRVVSSSHPLHTMSTPAAAAAAAAGAAAVKARSSPPPRSAVMRSPTVQGNVVSSPPVFSPNIANVSTVPVPVRATVPKSSTTSP
jgi:hypothetical protein